METEVPPSCPYPSITCVGMDCVWFDYKDCLCTFPMMMEMRKD